MPTLTKLRMQWLSLAATLFLSAVGWLTLLAADRRELQTAQADHERRIEALEDARRNADNALTEIRTDVRWIRQELQKKQDHP